MTTETPEEGRRRTGPGMWNGARLLFSVIYLIIHVLLCSGRLFITYSARSLVYFIIAVAVCVRLVSVIHTMSFMRYLIIKYPIRLSLSRVTNKSAIQFTPV